MKSIEENTIHNRLHYNNTYKDVNISGIVNKINNLDVFLADATTTDTSWVCMYYDGFKEDLKSRRILELGCGDCTNAAVMAKLGAEVWANDISDKPSDIINALNEVIDVKHSLKYLKGDFLELDIEENFFDIVVGKAFVHHLTEKQEEQFLIKIKKILKPNGKVRFVEPAVNSKWLDSLRWMIPMNDRPSSLAPNKFKKWKLSDPHPERDNSGKHYKSVGELFFEDVMINSVGMFERFHRFFPRAKWNRKFRRRALVFERYFPKYLRYVFARTQIINYYNPKN